MRELERAVRLVRALGLAPYDYIQGKYSLNEKYRVAGFAVHLLLSAAGTRAIAGMIPETTLESSPALYFVSIAGPILNACRSCMFLALLWWWQYPLLLEVLNMGIFRSLPPLRRKDVVLPVLMPAIYFVSCTMFISSLIVLKPLALLDNLVSIICSLPVFLQIMAVEVDSALFVFLLGCVAVQIDAGNESLKEMAQSAAADGSTAANIELEVIVSLRRKHREAVLVTQKLCSAFGLMVFVGFLIEMCWAVRLAFVLLTDKGVSVLVTVLKVADVMKSFLPKLIMMIVTQQLTDEANHTTVSRIHALKNSNCLLNKDMRRELNEFSKQICQHPLLVSVNKIVVLDLPFFFQAFGLAATYVVVLLQFHQSVA